MDLKRTLPPTLWVRIFSSLNRMELTNYGTDVFDIRDTFDLISDLCILGITSQCETHENVPQEFFNPVKHPIDWTHCWCLHLKRLFQNLY